MNELSQMNDLEAIKTDIEMFINKYNITYIGINIEEHEPKICKAGEENKPYKKALITIEF